MFMRNTILIFLSFIFVWACNDVNKAINIADLKCENLYNPMGLDKTIPRFSWKINSNLNATEQTAYQILVASNTDLLSESKANLWNSGKIDSDESIWVSYKGNELKSGYHACWKVRVWDNKGNTSEWSEPAEFGIGLLNSSDWEAKYIAYNTEKEYSECPQLYKSFNINETTEKLYLHVNSLGYHEVYINGKKVGDGVLTPAVSQYNKRSLINTYDVSSYLKKGKNNLIIWLGSGWYSKDLPGVVNKGPVVKAQLEKLTNNQREIVIATDETWKGRRSSYTRHGTWRPHNFGGEIINAQIAKTDLQIGNIPEHHWQPVSVVNIPTHEVTPQMVELNKIVNTFIPINISEMGKDTFIVDMGKNLTGWLEIDFSKLAKSQEIKIEYNDHIDKESGFSPTCDFYDAYIAAGDNSETFENKFNYHAFRYVRITGLSEKPEINSIKGHLIHTDYEPAAGFECSDPDLNKIHDMIYYTLQCLSLGGDLVDCPHYERLGYGGDGNASTLTVQTMYNVGPLYNNWLQAWGDVIREDGGMPHTAPNPWSAGGGPYWCGFIITATWNTYLNYGDISLLEKFYPTMQKWLGYVDHYSYDGLLQKWPDTDYRGWFLGDWATPDGINQTDSTSISVVNNSFLAICYKQMQKIATVLGKTNDVKLYAEREKQYQQKIHETYFDADNNTYATGTQVDLAFPMNAGVVPDSLYENVKNAFYKETMENRRGHIGCGLVGIPVITEWTTKNQAADLMYTMLKKEEKPGYLCMMNEGGTTTWEYWDGGRSRIHNCYNAIGSWFYQAVGGIQTIEDSPAYKKVRIQPQIPNGVTWAKIFKETPYGKLSIDWELNNNKLTMNIETPVGTEAEVIFPDDTKEFVLDGDVHKMEDGSQKLINLKSGKYTIEYKLSIST